MIGSVSTLQSLASTWQTVGITFIVLFSIFFLAFCVGCVAVVCRS